MSKLFSKHLHLCFFKLKYPTILCQQHDHDTSSPSPSPKPPSTPDSTMFQSPYDGTSSAHSTSKSTEDYFSSSTSSSDSISMELPDLASIFASQRFFFSSPGSSNSIIESPDTRPYNSPNTTSNNNTLIPRGGIRVPKYSLNPYVDFLRSMQEMIDSRQVLDVRKDWDYLHELLLCYLALNPIHTHKYIVRAFTDLVVDLLSSSSSYSRPVLKITPCRKHKNRRHTSFSGRLG